MKTFSTSGTGSGQTLSEIETDKIPVYDDLDAVTADLANLSDGQIGTTKDTGSELSAPVDTVQSGNMHAVTSNAVAGAISYSLTEKECGEYFDKKKYHKSFIYENVSITAGTPQVLQNDFEISSSKAVGINGFASKGDFIFNNVGFYIANNSLCIYPAHTGTFFIIVDVQYVK